MKPKTIKKHFNKKIKLFPAVPNADKNHMGGYWIRDNYWIWRAGYKRKQIAKGIKNYVKHHTQKIQELTQNPPMYQPEKHLPPKINTQNYELTHPWGNKQIDAYANATQILAHHNHTQQAKTMKKYLDTLGIGPDHGIWEQKPHIQPYTTACLAAAYKTLHKQTNLNLRKKYTALEQITQTLMQQHPPDLQMLFVPLTTTTLNKKTTTQAINKTRPLHHPGKGYKRHRNDTWTGTKHDKTHTGYWPLGTAAKKHNPQLPHHTQKTAEKTLHQIHRKHQAIPEQITKNNQPNKNTPLLWAETMHHSKTPQTTETALLGV